MRAAVATCLLGAVAIVSAGFATTQLPAAAAGGLLHPFRRASSRPPPERCQAAMFAGDGVALSGWRCVTPQSRRGTLVYLHGVADNRTSSVGPIQRFLARGFDVVAYDSRAHGESEGRYCTYGFFEKRDLRRVIDTLGGGPIVLIGTSLGAAVALQTAADETRVSAVVAAETFSDLKTVAHERAPFFLSESVITQAFALAEERAGFAIDEVSPVEAAARIRVPVLLLHGALDRETSPMHSQRVFARLREPKRLMLLPGVGHNESFGGQAWAAIEAWIDDALSAPHQRRD